MRELIYRKIAEKIANDITAGLMHEGERLPGVRELASEWDTSANTVLKALGELEDAGLIRKRRGQGIFVETRNRTGGKTANCRIIFSAADLDAPLSRLLLSASEKAASEAGCSLSVSTGTGNTSGGAGIVVPEQVPTNSDGAAGRNIYIGEFIPAHSFEGSYITADSYGGFRRAARMLLEAGRERIAYIRATDSLSDEPGWNAVRDVLAGTSNGFNREYAVNAGGWNAELGRRAMEELLLGGEYPDAVVCCNDVLAAGVYRACRAAGLSIPDDVAVVGAGDQDIALMLDPPLTSIKIPSAVMGVMAVGYLKAVESGSIGRTERLRARLDMEIIIRESFPAGDNVFEGEEPDIDEAWL